MDAEDVAEATHVLQQMNVPSSCAKSQLRLHPPCRVMPQGVMFVEIRRCVYGHELEGYKHANERGDLEMVGGSHEEREGILGSYGAWRATRR